MPGDLQKQPLLGTHASCLSRGYPKEDGVKLVDPLDESTLARIRLSGGGSIKIEIVPSYPAVRRNLSDTVYSVAQQFPVFLRIDGTPGNAAVHPNDGERLRVLALQSLDSRTHLAKGHQRLNFQSRFRFRFLAHSASDLLIAPALLQVIQLLRQ